MKPCDVNKLNDEYFEHFVKVVRTTALISESIKKKDIDDLLVEKEHHESNMKSVKKRIISILKEL